MARAILKLKKDQERRLRFGHCWVYSNEIDTKVSPLKEFEPGQLVDIVSQRNQWIGMGYVNPHSLICARIVSRDRDHPLESGLLVHRLKVALSLRERFFPAPYYRLVFGESDGLPGLVVDRYGDYIVVQITTMGMECFREEIVAAIDKVLKPKAILLRNDTKIRELEGLSLYSEVALGDLPEQVQLEENGISFSVSLLTGQKTGWFFDQAVNRSRMTPYVKDRRVLDVCSYVGAWGVQAAVRGASEVVCVDQSASALEGVEKNAVLNGVDDRMQAYSGDAFDVLKALRAEKQKFDVVMLDPPAFIKKKKDTKNGMAAYRRLNEMGLQLLSKDGVLITSSCSYHMPREQLLQLVQQAGRHTDRSLQLLESGQQGPDHPVHPAIPETAYLKTFFLRVVPTF